MDINHKTVMVFSLLLTMLPFASTYGDPVTIMATPSHAASPNSGIIGYVPTLIIEAFPGSNSPHNGTEIAVWDPAATPLFGISCPLPGASGGTKWELRADNAPVDGTFETVVSYELLSSGGSISFEFGDGGTVTISTSGPGVSFAPPAAAAYAWVDNSGNGGTDNTLAVGEYKFASCGREGDGFEQFFLGTTTFVVAECILTPQQHEDPISMNTVRSGKIAKTIHAEKQIFNCALEQGNIPVIVDVTIIAEIFEDMNTQSIIKKQALVITCVKSETSAAVIDCESEVPSSNPVPVKECFEFSQITHPQEMNTVNKGSIAKTIEAQKEVFVCEMNLDPDSFDPLDDKKVDLVIFTEIWEDMRFPEDPILSTAFEYFRCVVLLSEASVESCRFGTIQN